MRALFKEVHHNLMLWLLAFVPRAALLSHATGSVADVVDILQRTG
jgi:hypothetical protein